MDNLQNGHPLVPLCWWSTAERAMLAAAMKYGFNWYEYCTVERIHA